MGIYDRDYARHEQAGIQLGGPRTMVTNLILIQVAVYLVQVFSRPAMPPGQIPLDVGWFTGTFKLDADLFRQPWHCYQLLTYGFLHSPHSIGHIIFNMLALWFLGRDVERRYGRREFLWLYLSAIIFAGLVWMVAENLTGHPLAMSSVLGASGGVTCVVILFALNFPRRMLLLWFVIPVPAWIIGVLVVLSDIFGAAESTESNVAFIAHLGGALYAFIFFRTRWSLIRAVPQNLWPQNFWSKILRRGPRLRVHTPEEREEQDSQQVDEILRKIKQQGQNSLTRKERRILEEASRRYQEKRE